MLSPYCILHMRNRSSLVCFLKHKLSFHNMSPPTEDDAAGFSNLILKLDTQALSQNLETNSVCWKRYVSAGKPDKAVKVFLSMHEYGCQQDLNSFNTFLDVLCKSRRVEMAFNLFKVLKRRFRADTISYNIIANGLSEPLGRWRCRGRWWRVVSSQLSRRIMSFLMGTSRPVI